MLSTFARVNDRELRWTSFAWCCVSSLRVRVSPPSRFALRWTPFASEVSEGWLAIRSSLTFQASEGWYRYGDLRKVGTSPSRVLPHSVSVRLQKYSFDKPTGSLPTESYRFAGVIPSLKAAILHKHPV
jgi:hypothetical protein